jgi:hypothetical protein
MLPASSELFNQKAVDAPLAGFGACRDKEKGRRERNALFCLQEMSNVTERNYLPLLPGPLVVVVVLASLPCFTWP